jgi:hypothetical protein
VWGMIVYKVFFRTNAPEDPVAFVPNKTIKKSAATLPDTFELYLNYADPFLKNEKRVIPTNPPATKKAVGAKPRKSVVTVNFPAVKYDGLIKKQENELAIVSINGSSHFMKTGETANEVKLIRICNDSIIVSFQNQKRTIKK